MYLKIETYYVYDLLIAQTWFFFSSTLFLMLTRLTMQFQAFMYNIKGIQRRLMCNKWRVKSDALLTTRSFGLFNGLKHDIAFYRPITENCFLMFRQTLKYALKIAKKYFLNFLLRLKIILNSHK